MNGLCPESMEKFNDNSMCSSLGESKFRILKYKGYKRWKEDYDEYCERERNKNVSSGKVTLNSNNWLDRNSVKEAYLGLSLRGKDGSIVPNLDCNSNLIKDRNEVGLLNAKMEVQEKNKSLD